MQHSDQINEIASALAKAQGQIGAAEKNASNPFFQSRYATLAAVWQACRTPLSDNGLAIVQGAVMGVGEAPSVIVHTLMVHASGQWFATELAMEPKDRTPQAIGSCLSYARRYALAALVGVYQADDDAETAQGRVSKPESVPWLEGESLSVHKRDTVLPALIKALKAVDSQGLKTHWNPLTPLEQADVWKLLTSKQKALFRELIQQDTGVDIPDSELPPVESYETDTARAHMDDILP